MDSASLQELENGHLVTVEATAQMMGSIRFRSVFWWVDQHHSGLQSRSRKESEFFGWSRSRIPNNTGSRSRIFCPTLDVWLNHFLYHTPKLGIPVEMVQFLFKLLLKQISCCAPRFPLILTAKFHSLCVKESGVGVRNFGKVGVGSQKFWKVGVGSRNFWEVHLARLLHVSTEKWERARMEQRGCSWTR